MIASPVGVGVRSRAVTSRAGAQNIIERSTTACQRRAGRPPRTTGSGQRRKRALARLLAYCARYARSNIQLANGYSQQQQQQRQRYMRTACTRSVDSDDTKTKTGELNKTGNEIYSRCSVVASK